MPPPGLHGSVCLPLFWDIAAVAVTEAVVPAKAIAVSPAVAVAFAVSLAVAVAVAVAHTVAVAVWPSAAVDEEPVESLNDQHAMSFAEWFNRDDCDHSACHSSGHLPLSA